MLIWLMHSGHSRTVRQSLGHSSLRPLMQGWTQLLRPLTVPKLLTFHRVTWHGGTPASFRMQAQQKARRRLHPSRSWTRVIVIPSLLAPQHLSHLCLLTSTSRPRNTLGSSRQRFFGLSVHSLMLAWLCSTQNARMLPLWQNLHVHAVVPSCQQHTGHSSALRSDKRHGAPTAMRMGTHSRWAVKNDFHAATAVLRTTVARLAQSDRNGHCRAEADDDFGRHSPSRLPRHQGILTIRSGLKALPTIVQEHQRMIVVHMQGLTLVHPTTI